MKPITCLVAATVAVAFAIPTHAQVNTDAVDAILRAHALGAEIKAKRDALALQRQIFEAQQIARGSAEDETVLLGASADLEARNEDGHTPLDYAGEAEFFASQTTLAERGDAAAQNSLGYMYATGRGVLKDEAEAAMWYRLAAEQGYFYAQTTLGSMYNFGRGVPQDYPEAARWYRLAAEQGDPIAQAALGIGYALGEGVLKDSVLAHMWLNIAGANGSEPAREARDEVEGDMTRAEIRRATELARACLASNYQDCEP